MVPGHTGGGRPKTKIVCTLGPACESAESIRTLVECGMSVARLNLSHGTLETHATAIGHVRSAAADLGVPVGVLVDVPGPKYRTGPLAPGAIELKPGDKLTLTSDDLIGTPELIGVTPPGIHRDATVGHPILLDDGRVELRVVDVQGSNVLCEVVIGQRLTERRSVTTPGRAPSQVFPGRQAVEALKFAAEQDADFVALSTITTERDVAKAREILEQSGCQALVVSKIERAEALDHFEAILAASDAVMVARGDMGVEVPLARVPVIQKDLIARCNAVGKPVITATQMLESMVEHETPTRAEVTDVANAVFDGTDAVMLSGETSVGHYPDRAVRVMVEIAVEAESAMAYETIIREKAGQLEEQTDDAISYDACRTASQLNASLIVAFTESGGTAGRVSKYRPRPPILALTPGERVQRRLTLRWGVTPLIVENLQTVEDFFTVALERATGISHVRPGDLIVLVAGLPIGVTGGTNLLRVMQIPSD